MSPVQLANKLREVCKGCYRVSSMQQVAYGSVTTVISMVPREDLSIYQIAIWRDVFCELLSAYGYQLRGDDEQYIVYRFPE